MRPVRPGLPRLVRSGSNRVVRGVAGGVGEQLGVDPLFVRIAFVVLTGASFVGLFVYAALLGFSREPGPEAAPRRAPEQRQTLAFAMVVGGVLILLGEGNLWFSGPAPLSLTLMAVGSVFIWSRAADPRWARWGPQAWMDALLRGRVSVTRVAFGALLVVAGLALFGRTGVLDAMGRVGTATAVTLLGAALIVGPWVLRLVQQLGDERAERVRSEERAELAAHLHDSVLQTLALIQRSEDPRKMAALARGQERELRTWLYGKPRTEDGETLHEALEAAADRIERDHQVAIEVVVVGDGPLDRAGRGLVKAAAEAMLNAARHSGAATVSVYAEAGPEALQVFVSDEGKGFDPAAVGSDRRGIADSIHGRVHALGGTVTITSERGEGTEVALSAPRRMP